MRRLLPLAPLLAGFALPAWAQTPPAPVSAPAALSAPAPDYTQASAWLCRDGQGVACQVDLTATRVAADGTLTAVPFTPAAAPAVDCFYVYPTVSRDLTANSDLNAGLEELSVYHHQAARFAASCRVFAPLYRQVTLSALRAAMLGLPVQPDRAMAYQDVRAAWQEYLARDNGGRGVVLIGHSQGTGALARLLREEILGKPIQQRLVSALLIGGSLPDTSAAGLPPCTQERLTGCIVAYVSFRADTPPPAESRFGRVEGGGPALCVNPASLDDGSAPLDAYLANRAAIVSEAAEAAAPWATGAVVETPFVTVPGLLTGACVERDGFRYLAVTTNADPADPRLDRIAGDVVIAGQPQAGWGLHLIDMHLAMGDLVSLVARQAEAWAAR